VRLRARIPAPPPVSEDRLEAFGVKVLFTGVRAVDGVDLTLERNEILGVIGPNGAGKTTLVNALSGFQPVTEGRIELGGVDVTSSSPERLARAGVVRTFQTVRLFAGLTVLENVEASSAARAADRSSASESALAALDLMQLTDRAHEPARALSHGQQRRLGIARALATRPRFLLLDEPAAGLNEDESEELREALQRIHADFECGLLIIEHDMDVIMRLCSRIQVLNYGTTICIGTPAEVQEDAAVVLAYLGAPQERAGA
jgi:branched-chain amino acid transport system ATP-binding protein